MSINYTFVNRQGDDFTSIGINGGKYEGVVYRYGKVSFGEENSDGTLPFHFEYNIIDNVGILREDFGEEFFTLIGDILVDIIDDQIEEDNLEYKPDN